MNTMNEDLQRERAKATFVTERLTNHILDGGSPIGDVNWKQLWQAIPTFSNQDDIYMSVSPGTSCSCAIPKSVASWELVMAAKNIFDSPDWPVWFSLMPLPTTCHWPFTGSCSRPIYTLSVCGMKNSRKKGFPNA
jgi:hypothetical protein